MDRHLPGILRNPRSHLRHNLMMLLPPCAAGARLAGAQLTGGKYNFINIINTHSAGAGARRRKQPPGSRCWRKQPPGSRCWGKQPPGSKCLGS